MWSMSHTCPEQGSVSLGSARGERRYGPQSTHLRLRSHYMIQVVSRKVHFPEMPLRGTSIRVRHCGGELQRPEPRDEGRETHFSQMVNVLDPPAFELGKYCKPRVSELPGGVRSCRSHPEKQPAGAGRGHPPGPRILDSDSVEERKLVGRNPVGSGGGVAERGVGDRRDRGGDR